MGNQYYKYGGTEFDAHLPMTGPEPKRAIPGAAKCATRTGYIAHRRNGETPCDPCRDASNAYDRDYRERAKGRKSVKSWTKAQCGTVAGYTSHRRHAVLPCQACTTAVTEYNKARRDAKKKAAA